MIMSNFIERYYPQLIYNEQIQKEMLKILVEDYCDCSKSIKTRIINGLYRRGIMSIEQLYKTPIEYISLERSIGPVALEEIKKIKKEILGAITSKEKSTFRQWEYSKGTLN